MIVLNKIYNESALDCMKRMQEGLIDLTVTSPPYDDLRNYEGYSFSHEDIIPELYRVTKQGGIVVWIVNDQVLRSTKLRGSESGNSFRQALCFMENGWRLHDTMIYRKVNPTPNANKRYQQCFEYMFVFSKGRPKTTNILLRKSRSFKDKRIRFKAFHRDQNGDFRKNLFIPKEFVPKDNIWEYIVGGNNVTKDEVAYLHPAIFPEQLAEDHILSWSNKGDLVFDPFMGSGTTAKMARLNGRSYIGSDLSKFYCEIAEDRIKMCA